ncbi:MAG: tetratricopeptide repeat protein [Bacteroidales bacterium]|nr:tetratricopeptide repeat protein [Bacteroidales bacterium]
MRYFLSIITLIASLPLWAHSGYDVLATKAAQFYERHNWASASAMYTLMVDERPSQSSTYAYAIVADGMRHESVSQMEMMRKAMANHVSFDSIFNQVATFSYQLGETTLYEDFLLKLKEEEPWMERTIDNYLLQYYTYRSNPEKMIEYSEKMLKGMPDNEGFLYTLAQGYLLNGEYSQAVATYESIITNNPKAYQALLYLGNFYMYLSNQGEEQCQEKAITYLSQANSLHATPFVTASLTALNQ